MALEMSKNFTSSNPLFAADKEPLQKSGYTVLDTISRGVGASVIKANSDHGNPNEVAIKAIDLKKSRSGLVQIKGELKKHEHLHHRNTLKPLCHFVEGDEFWVVMPFMSGGSLLYAMNNIFPDGMPEACIAAALKEVLNALVYIHGEGHVHKDIKAGNILIGSNGDVKLSDFGFSSSIYNCNYSSASLPMFTDSLDVNGIPYWLPHEVIKSPESYTSKADIWAFGILAMELAHGKPPITDAPMTNALRIKIMNRFHIFESRGMMDKTIMNFSEEFKEMVRLCLSPDLSERPAAEELLMHPFFKKSQGPQFLIKSIQDKWPQKDIAVVTKEKINKAVMFEIMGGIAARSVRWKFNEETFYMDPASDHEENGNVKLHEVKAAEGHKESCVKYTVEYLKVILENSRYQQQLVQKLIICVNAYKMMQERALQKILDLSEELDNERMKQLSLEIEIERIKKSGGDEEIEYDS